MNYKAIGGGDIPHELYEVTLKPGDFLILPRGVWHGTTASEYSYSINITISEPTWLDAILNEVRRKLITESMYRKPYRMKDMVTGNINTDLGRINITPKQSDIHEQYLITNKIVRTALKNLTKSFNEGC